MTTHYIEQLNSYNNSVFKLFKAKILTNSLGNFIFYAQMIHLTYFLERY